MSMFYLSIIKLIHCSRCFVLLTCAWALMFFCFQILHYDFPKATITSDLFKYRLEWFAPVKTSDTLVASLYLHNVTFNDTGTYRCSFDRIVHLPVGDESFRITKYIEFTVLPEGKTSVSI